MRRYVDLSEKVTATYYDEQYEEWDHHTVTVEDVLNEVCDDYTVLSSVQPEYTEQDMREQFNAGYACGMHAAQPETKERTAESAQNVPKDELISKKAAIGAVLDQCPSDYENEYECGYYDALKEAVPMLIHVPSVQPHRWIPVAERLPEEYGEYLVTKRAIGWNCKEYDLVDIAYYEGGFHKADKVVAWMPLPPSYKGGQE